MCSGKTNSTMNENEQSGKQATGALYGVKYGCGLGCGRASKFTVNVASSNIYFSPERLPPTNDFIIQTWLGKRYWVGSSAKGVINLSYDQEIQQHLILF